MGKKMSDSTDWGLLARFLAGECSEEEKGRIEAWARADPERREVMHLRRVVSKATALGFTYDMEDPSGRWRGYDGVANITQLSMIAILTGRKIRWDPEREGILDDPGASQLLTRAMRSPWHL